MPPELRYASGPQLRRELRTEKLDKNTQHFDSEIWEAQRSQVIDEIGAALQRGELEDVQAFELTCLMSRYSLKDGLMLAKKTHLDDGSTANLVREYGEAHALQQRLVAGKSLNERLLEFLDYRRSSPLGLSVRDSYWPDKVRKAHDFLQSADVLAAQDPELEQKTKALLRSKNDPVSREAGYEPIGDLSFDATTLPFKEKIDRLYDPFYETVDIEGKGRVKKFEVSPTVSEAHQYLKEWVEIAVHRPVFFVPVQEWLFKELFQTKVVIQGLHWPDVEVKSAVHPGKKMPLREAIKEYMGSSIDRSMDAAWARAQLFTEPSEKTDDSVPVKDLTGYMGKIGLDTTRLDIQGLLKRNSVHKLEITFKTRCRDYAQRLSAERQQLEERLIPLRKRGTYAASILESKLQSTQELEEVFTKLVAGEMDLDALRNNPFYGSAPYFSASLQERNFASAGQSKTLMQVLHGFSPTDRREMGPAKYDHFSQAELEEVFQQVFPHFDLAVFKQLRARNLAEGAYATGSREPRIVDAESYFDPSDESYGVDGDPKEAYPVELLNASQPVDAILVTGVYDTRDETVGAWKSNKVTFSTETPVDLPRQTVVFQLPAKVGMALPIALHGACDRRVIGVTEKGKQVPVVVVKDTVGRIIVESFPPEVKSIAYAQEVPELLPSVTDISEDKYTEWRNKQGSKDHPVQTPEQALRLLPNDCRRFVEEVRVLPPAERVRRVEDFVRTIGYYDFQNGETKNERVGTSLKVRWELMRQRMRRLQREQPNNQELASKKVAGVCVDFQELTTALLRAVNCVAGKLSALRMHHTAKATSQDAHALSYVEWPTATGGSMRIPVDGTPGGTDVGEREDLARIQEPTQASRAQKLETYRFEEELEVTDRKAEGKAFQKAPVLAREQVSVVKQPAKVLEEAPERKQVSVTKERMTDYLRTSLSTQELHALYRVVGWMAYSGGLEELTKLGDTPGALRREGQLKLELAQVYKGSEQEVLPKDQASEPASIVRDWERVCHKLHASEYTPTRLADLVRDALPRATDEKSKRDRSITYLGKILSV